MHKIKQAYNIICSDMLRFLHKTSSKTTNHAPLPTSSNSSVLNRNT